MDTAFDLLAPSPPVSPARKDAVTPTQATQGRLKRLSLVSGAVFNTNESPVEVNVRDAMLDNPSFSSPPHTRESNPEETPSTPTQHAGTARTRAGSVVDSVKHARTPTVRLGYRHSTAPASRTPQARARRSSSRERTVEPTYEAHDDERLNVDSGPSHRTASHLAPRPTSLPTPRVDAEPSPSVRTRPPRAPLTLIEKHADLLAYIAQKEREANDARRTYERKLDELEQVRKRWEAITARKQGFHSTTTPSASAGGKHHHQAPVPVRRTASTSSTGSSGSMEPPMLPLTAPAHDSAHPNASSAVVEGSRRLFGQLMDSLSGITSDLALGTTEDEATSTGPGAGPGTGTGTAAGAGADGAPASRGDTERKRDTAQMRRLIAGTGREDRPVKPRRTSTASTELPPDPDPARQEPSSASSPVDFTNIWDGLAPQARDWKEKLGNVMGVTAPTIHSSQKKASEFLTTNLTHTLDFFSQALPTPNLGATSPAPTSQAGSTTRLQRRPLTRGTSDASVDGPGGKAAGGEVDIPWNW